MDYKDLLKEVSLKLAGAINPGFAGISPFLSLLKDANNQTTNTSTVTGTPAVVAPITNMSDLTARDISQQVIKNNLSLPSQSTKVDINGYDFNAIKEAFTKMESGGDYAASSDGKGIYTPSSSIGRWQITPKFHFSKIGLNSNNQADIQKFISNPALQDQLFSIIIKENLDKTDGDLGKAAAMYYGGENARFYGTQKGNTITDKFGRVSLNQYGQQIVDSYNKALSSGVTSDTASTFSSPTITSDASSSYLDQTLKQLQSDSGLTLSEADKQARIQLAVEDPNNPFGSYQKQFNSMLKTEFDTMKLYETQWGDSLARLDSNVSAVLKEADSLTSELNRASRQSRIEQGGTEYLPTVLADEIVLNKLAQRSYILDKMNETEKMRNDIISNLQNSRFQSIKQITGLLDDYNKTKDSIRTDLLTMDKNSRAEKQQLYNLIKSENQNTLQQDRETRLTNQTLYTNAIGQIESQAPGVALVQDPAERKAKIDSLVSQYSAMLSKQGVTPEQLRGVIEGYVTSYRVKNGLENVTNTTGNIVTLTPPTANTTSTTTQATDLLSSYGI